MIIRYLGKKIIKYSCKYSVSTNKRNMAQVGQTWGLKRSSVPVIMKFLVYFSLDKHLNFHFMFLYVRSLDLLMHCEKSSVNNVALMLP